MTSVLDRHQRVDSINFRVNYLLNRSSAGRDLLIQVEEHHEANNFRIEHWIRISVEYAVSAAQHRHPGTHYVFDDLLQWSNVATELRPPSSIVGHHAAPLPALPLQNGHQRALCSFPLLPLALWHFLALSSLRSLPLRPPWTPGRSSMAAPPSCCCCAAVAGSRPSQTRRCPGRPSPSRGWPFLGCCSPAELPPLCSVFSFSQRKKKATLPLLVSLTCGTRELYFFLKSTDFVLML